MTQKNREGYQWIGSGASIVELSGTNTYEHTICHLKDRIVALHAGPSKTQSVCLQFHADEMEKS